MNAHSTPSDLFSVIIEKVVTGKDSPYNLMMKKTKNIDIDFFEKICRGINTLSDELNLELKDKVINAFEEMADGYYKKGDFEFQLLAMIQKEAEGIKNNVGEGAVEFFLSYLSDNLTFYARGSNIDAGFSRYTNAEVEDLYQNAKHVTLKEFFMGGNDQEILTFYNALMDNTWWACREVVVNRTKDFLLRLAMKTREVGTIL